MSRVLSAKLKTIQFQEHSTFVWHELCFATARLLPVQAINYCHFKCITGIHGYTLTTSILLLLSSFYFASKSNVISCSEQGTRSGSAVRESVESATVWVGRDRLHMEMCGNTDRIPYCFSNCYLQCHRQTLKLYILILKCPACNPLRAKCWRYQNWLGLCHDFTQTRSLHRVYIKMMKPRGWTVSFLIPCRPHLQFLWDNMKGLLTQQK